MKTLRLALVATPLLLCGCGEDEAVEGAAGGDAFPELGSVPVDSVEHLTGLEGPVEVVRDRFGMLHIHATKLGDLFRVQGYMQAVDRGGQIEIARRFASGRIAEILAGVDSSYIEEDISMRTIGLRRSSQAAYEALEGESLAKQILDSYADGVSQYNAALATRDVHLPKAIVGLRSDAFPAWSPVDSLAMGRLLTMNLSYDADSEIAFTELVDSIRTTFHDAATDPQLVRRKAFMQDAIRFAPSDPTTPLDGFPDDDPVSERRFPGGDGPAKAIAPRPPLERGVIEKAAGFRRAVRDVQRYFGFDEDSGSNNWTVAGAKTETGNAMLANDPHLGLSSPMFFWPVQLVLRDPDDPSQNFDIAGVSLIGIPGVILGTNGKLGWGATTAAYDVTDVWREKVSADGKGVMRGGKQIDFEHVKETLKIFSKPDYTWDVLAVPGHGPIVPEFDVDHRVIPPAPGSEVLSVGWTGHQSTNEVQAIINLIHAETVNDARVAMTPFGTGAQNWNFADTNGDIFFTTKSNLPFRDERTLAWDAATKEGQLPCLVLDGEAGEHEWTGDFLEERYIPKLKNPERGFIATANGDNVGGTLDDDPSNDELPDGRRFYLGCDFDLGFRIGRIHERIEAAIGGGKKITADEMASIQGDVQSAHGKTLAPALVTALEHAEAERTSAGAHPDLAAVVADPAYAAAKVPEIIALLDGWGGKHDYEASSGVNPDDGSLDVDAAEAESSRATAIFNAWLVRVLALTFGDEAAAVGRGLPTKYASTAFIRLVNEDPQKLATFDALTGQSAIWDDLATPEEESRDERFVRALLSGLEALEARFGADREGWRWGHLHTVRFDALIPLWNIAIPLSTDEHFSDGFPRHGDQWAVDASNFALVQAAGLNMKYDSGPVQRVVIEMAPDAPVIHNALPGGAVYDPTSPHFADEAELWRRNQTHQVPYRIEDTVENAEERLQFTP